jgi:hypothetical protein
MATETTTTNICDRCGSRHDSERYSAGSSWAQLNLTWNGDKGGRTAQGDAGGVNLKGKAWLCEPCVNAFLEFLRPSTSQIDPREHAFRQALHDYPGRNTHQLQARKVCAGVLALAEAAIERGR